MVEVTVIYFSCRRLDLLYRSIQSFLKVNTYPIAEFIIVNDSGNEGIHRELMNGYGGVTFVLHPENVGLIKSVDLGYSHIKTEYFFHCEDDWCVTKDFIWDSLKIMEDPKIEEVWLADYNGHPLEEKVYVTAGPLVKGYKLACDNYQKGQNGYNDFAWHGFTTACGMKRLNDYKKVGPYSEIPWQGTIWHREQAIGERYHDLGYRTACLLDERAVNIGYGRSEYKSGLEK